MQSLSGRWLRQSVVLSFSEVLLLALLAVLLLCKKIRSLSILIVLNLGARGVFKINVGSIHINTLVHNGIMRLLLISRKKYVSVYQKNTACLECWWFLL